MRSGLAARLLQFDMHGSARARLGPNTATVGVDNSLGYGQSEASTAARPRPRMVLSLIHISEPTRPY